MRMCIQDVSKILIIGNKMSLVNKLLEYKDNEKLINKLVEESIQYKINSGIYPPRNKWSIGYNNMIINNTRTVINHKFDAAILLLKSIENNIN